MSGKATTGSKRMLWYSVTAVLSWAWGWLVGRQQANSLMQGQMRLQRQVLEQEKVEAALREAKQAAEEANLAKNEFVSFVSHELQTPMTTIMGYIDFLTDEENGPPSEAEMEMLLGVIRTNVTRMATIVSDMQDISHMEMGQLSLSCGFVALADVVAEVQASVNGKIQGKEQQLQVSMPIDLPLVWVDYGRTLQILSNLVSNAHKYTPEGGEIAITMTPLMEENAVQVAVTDNGYGISEADQTMIFTKFFRSQDKDIRRVLGTGLGLNIVKQLVEMQNGRIWFQSQYGEGTTFYFTLPTVKPDIDRPGSI